MSLNKETAFALFEYDVVATVATGTIFIEPFLISSLQNLAEFIGGVPVWGHQLASQLPHVAEEIRKQQPFFDTLANEIEKRKVNGDSPPECLEWYQATKKEYITQYGEFVKLNKVNCLEMVNPEDYFDERNTFPDDSDRIIKL